MTIKTIRIVEEKTRTAVKELNIYSDESGQTDKAPFVSASIVSAGEINFSAKKLNKRNFLEVKEKLKEIGTKYSKYVPIGANRNTRFS